MNQDNKSRLSTFAKVASMIISILGGIALVYQSGAAKWYSLLGIMLLVLGGYLISKLKS